MQTEKIKTKLKVGDEAVVVSGRAKGQKGEILAINKEKGLVWMKGVNQRKRFMRPSQEMPKGGELHVESPVAISNVMFFDSKAKKPTRLGYKVDASGKKVRVAKVSGKEID